MGRRRSRVISWNGIVTYGAMAMGAPLGVLCFAWGGLQGLALTVMGVALLALPRPSVKTNKGNPLSFRAVLGRVWLYGMAQALASAGDGFFSGLSGAGRGGRQSRAAAEPGRGAGDQYRVYGYIFGDYRTAGRAGDDLGGRAGNLSGGGRAGSDGAIAYLALKKTDSVCTAGGRIIVLRLLDN